MPLGTVFLEPILGIGWEKKGYSHENLFIHYGQLILIHIYEILNRKCISRCMNTLMERQSLQFCCVMDHGLAAPVPGTLDVTRQVSGS